MRLFDTTKQVKYLLEYVNIGMYTVSKTMLDKLKKLDEESYVSIEYVVDVKKISTINLKNL